MNQSVSRLADDLVIRPVREVEVQDDAPIIVQGHFGFFDFGQFKIADFGSQRVTFFLQRFFLDRLIALPDRTFL